MSAEAARNLAEEASPEESGAATPKKPDLKLIEGGEETTPPKKGHLKAADAAQKAPFFRGVDKIKAGWKKVADIREETGERVLVATEKLDEGMQKTLRAEDPGDAPQDNILLPPTAAVYSVGDMADAAALTPARRVWEGTNTTGSLVRALYRTGTRPIPGFHFKETLFHPIKYAANPARVVTSTAKLAATAINAIPRSIDEIVNRGLKRPLQRFGKIPLLGHLGRGVGWLAKQPRRFFEWITRPVEIVDKWVKERQ